MSARVNRTLAALFVAIFALLSVAVTAAPSGAAAGFEFRRLSGDNRYGTAAAIATATFPSGAPEAVIATGTNFADALTGAYLTGFREGPLLLSQPDDVPAVTMEALDNLGVTSVTLLGGTAALDASVVSELEGAGYVVSRISGSNRYDTAAQIATIPGPTNVGVDDQGRRTAILATGLNFADALAGGPLSHALGFPILLSGNGVIPQDTVDALEELDIEHIVILGGGAAVSAGLEAALENEGYSTERLAGANREETAAVIAVYAIQRAGFDPTHVNVATGRNFADALAGAGHGGEEVAPILLLATAVETSATCDYLELVKVGLFTGDLFGGAGAISLADEAALEDCAGANDEPVQGAPNIPVFASTPSSLTANGIIEDNTDDDDRTYEAAGLENDKVYRVTLVDAGNIAPQPDGKVSFVDANDDDLADANGATPLTARIVAINGSTVAAAQSVGGIAPSNGRLNFTVDGAEAESLVPVVYEDPGTGPSTFLDLDASNQPIDRFGLGGRLDYTVVANDSIVVAPTATATIVANDIGSEANTPADDRTFSATNLNQALQYRVALLRSSSVSVNGGLYTFKDDNPADDRADTDPVPSARIVDVNGADVTPAQSVGGITPVGGQIDVTIDGDDPESVVLVVYADPGNGPTTGLDLDGANRPIDPFGVSGVTNFEPDDAPNGPLANDQEVGIVQPGPNVFFTQSLGGGNNQKYVYDANDLFYRAQNPTVADEVNVAASEVSISLDEFETQLSRGDQLSAGSNYAQSAAAQSVFILEDLGPGAPTVSGLTPSANGFRITVAGESGATFKVYVGPDDNGTFNAATDNLQATAATDADPSVAGFQVDVFGLAPSTQYDAYVTQTLDGDESSPSPVINVTTGASTPGLAITDVTINDTNDGTGSTEIVILNFNQTITSCNAENFVFVLQGSNPEITLDGDDCEINGSTVLIDVDLDGDELFFPGVDLAEGPQPFDPLSGDDESFTDMTPDQTWTVVVRLNALISGGQGNPKLFDAFVY